MAHVYASVCNSMVGVAPVRVQCEPGKVAALVSNQVKRHLTEYHQKPFDSPRCFFFIFVFE